MPAQTPEGRAGMTTHVHPSLLSWPTAVAETRGCSVVGFIKQTPCQRILKKSLSRLSEEIVSTSEARAMLLTALQP